MSFTTSWNSPAALGVLREGPLAGGLVFHALAGRLHVFPAPSVPADTVTALVRSGLVPIAARRAPTTEQASPSLEAVAALRRGVREALDPGKTWSYGSRWQRGE